MRDLAIYSTLTITQSATGSPDPRGLLSRPSLEDVNRYRHHVDEHVCDLLESVGPTKRRALGELIELGLNHEQQHQELILTDIKHALAGNPLRPAYRAREEPPNRLTATPVGWVAFPRTCGGSAMAVMVSHLTTRRPGTACSSLPSGSPRGR